MTMTKRLRITLLGVGAAAGLGIAVAVAMSSKPPEFPKARVVPPSARPTATATGPLESAVPAAESTASAASVASDPEVVRVFEHPAAGSPYRLFTQQLQYLQESFDHFRDHQDRRQRHMSDSLAQLQNRAGSSSEDPTPSEPAGDAGQERASEEDLPPAIKRHDDGMIEFSLEDASILDALKLLSQEADLDILVSKNVSGTVTASFRGVDVNAALAAILKSAGLVARNDNGIIYIGTTADLDAMDQSQDRVQTRIYRPNYISSADLMGLITPMLTTTGKVTVSAAAKVDIASDQTQTGGNDFGGPDVVVVRDYEAILRQVDELFVQVDVNPRQVSIEAMIINVKLDDEFTFGVNWETLLDRDNIRLVVGNPLTDLANLPTAEGGLKFGFLDASLSVFIEALEKIGDTNVIASPRVLCLNKQRAEIQIGEQLGYVNTTVTQTFSTQSVSFLDVGTLLRIRPFIGNDGRIRMEVHPELSTGTVTVDAGLTLPNKSVTQVTTNVMCEDGRTIVIGGLIREDLKTNTSQVPYFGNLPWVGALFRTKTEDTERSEIIVLITPRIVGEPAMGEEGAKYEHQFVTRHSVVFDKMSPIARRNYALRYQRLARAAFAAGDYPTALRQIDWSIQFDSMNREAINLREEIVAAGGIQESIPEYLNQARHPWDRPHLDYSQQGFPWRPEQMHHNGPTYFEPIDDPGVPGPTSTLGQPWPAAVEGAGLKPQQPEVVEQP